MPTSAIMQLPKSRSSDEFACICVDFLNFKYGGYQFQPYGRNGQSQHGIDLFAESFNIVAQCKNYFNPSNLISRLRNDYNNAMTYFQPPPQKFIAITSLDRDANIQLAVKDINYSIEIFFWDDIQAFICQNNDMLRKYYPSFFINEPQTVQSKNALFSLAFVGVQLSYLIELTLEDRQDALMHLNILKSGASWFTDSKTKGEFINTINAIEQFVHGDISVEDLCNFKSTRAYFLSHNIEIMVSILLNTLNTPDEKNVYLAGSYLGNFFKGEFSLHGVPEEYISQFTNVIMNMNLPEEQKKTLSDFALNLRNPLMYIDVISTLYEELRLAII